MFINKDKRKTEFRRERGRQSHRKPACQQLYPMMSRQANSMAAKLRACRSARILSRDKVRLGTVAGSDNLLIQFLIQPCKAETVHADDARSHAGAAIRFADARQSVVSCQLYDSA